MRDNSLRLQTAAAYAEVQLQVPQLSSTRLQECRGLCEVLGVLLLLGRQEREVRGRGRGVCVQGGRVVYGTDK